MQARIFQSSSRLFEAIARTLDNLVYSTSHVKHVKTIFDSSGLLNASLHSYLLRIFRFMNCSPANYVLALVFLDRIQAANPAYILNQKNVHRLLMTAILISVKTNDDIFYKQSYYAKVAGLEVPELNALEAKFLQELDFNAYVDPTLFNTYVQKLEQTETVDESPKSLKKRSESLSTVGSSKSKEKEKNEKEPVKIGD